MKDFSLISYHLGGLSIFLLFSLISLVHSYTEKYADFVSVNAGFVYNSSLTVLVDLVVTAWFLSVLYRLRHKIGKNYFLGMSTALILAISFIALVYVITIYIASQIRLF